VSLCLKQESLLLFFCDCLFESILVVSSLWVSVLLPPDWNKEGKRIYEVETIQWK
jgi:hypothetical protein